MRSHVYRPVGYDIFDEKDEDIDDCRIDYFVHEFALRYIEEVFTQDLSTPVFINKPIPYGTQDRYVGIVNNKEFFTNIFYYPTNTLISKLDNTIINGLSKQKDVKELNEFKKLLERNPDKKVVYFSFEDWEFRKSQTGEVREYAYQAFGEVIRAIRASLKNHIGQYIAFYYNVSRKELKRNKAYLTTIQAEAKYMNKTYIDDFSDIRYITTYLWSDRGGYPYKESNEVKYFSIG